MSQTFLASASSRLSSLVNDSIFGVTHLISIVHWSFHSSYEMDQKAKLCQRMHAAAFYDVFNRLHCSIELANDDEWGGSEKLCRKAAYLCSRRKKAGDEAIFAGPLLTRSFFAALSLQLTISVRESAPRVS